MYIYDLPGWPHFVWDRESVTRWLLEVRHQQGRLIGGMESLGFKWCDERVLETRTEEVVKSSEIEGEILDLSQVRSSVARHLGMEEGPIDAQVDGVVKMVVDATQRFEEPLTKERLFDWHRSLFSQERRKITIGGWRKGAVYIVSGQMGNEKVHFVAPPATRVESEMEALLHWVNQEAIDPLLKAAIAHLWFVVIHPFDDGNGRIGRAIADLLLARSENSNRRFYSLSKQIQKERKDYYAILQRTDTGTLEITAWIEWFFGCLGRAIEEASCTLEAVLEKARIWEKLAHLELNARQRKVLNALLDGFKGKLTSSKWAKIAKCSQDTALRDISDLMEKGVLEKSAGGGRSSSYLFSNRYYSN